MINRMQAFRRSREDQIARESNWAELAHTTRRLLIGEVDEFLSHITMMLEDQVILMSPSARRSWQESVVESGSLLCDLGSSLVALGHAISRISMGATQDDVGRAVFISQQGKIGYSRITLGCKQVLKQEGAYEFFHRGGDYRGITKNLNSISLYLGMQTIPALGMCKRSFQIQIQNMRW